MPLTANYPPYYGSSTPFTQPQANPAVAPTIPRGRGDWAQTTYALGGLGQAGAGRDLLFTAVTIAGSTLGGGLVGYVASKRNLQSARRGAIFSGGLTGVANGFGSFRGGNALVGSLAIAGGLGALWWVLRDL